MRCVFVFGVLLAGCATSFDFDGTEHVVSVDPSFTENERVEIHAAADLWRAETKGRLAIRLTDEHDAEVKILRGHAAALGHFDRTRGTIVLDADGLADYRAGVRSMAANMIGQYVGMPLHDGCGVLARHCVVPEFSDGDRASCEAVGACE